MSNLDLVHYFQLATPQVEIFFWFDESGSLPPVILLMYVKYSSFSQICYFFRSYVLVIAFQWTLLSIFLVFAFQWMIPHAFVSFSCCRWIGAWSGWHRWSDDWSCFYIVLLSVIDVFGAATIVVPYFGCNNDWFRWFWCDSDDICVKYVFWSWI